MGIRKAVLLSDIVYVLGSLSEKEILVLIIRNVLALFRRRKRTGSDFRGRLRDLNMRHH